MAIIYRLLERVKPSPTTHTQLPLRWLLIILNTVFVSLCAIVIINDFLYKPLMHKWIYMNQSQIFGSYEDLEPLDDILQAERQPSRRDSIFFHETSGEWKKLAFPSIYQSVDERINYAHLTFRQACAIESAALHNRKSDVFVLFAASRYMDAAIRNESRFKVLLHYKNVHFRNVHLWSYTLNTPGYAWLKKDEVFMSSFYVHRYFVSHISDFLRFMTLWRFGGTYLDTDTITLKSLELLPPNYAGIESKFNVAAGVINFSPDGFGHQLAEKCLIYFLKNYKYNEWNTNDAIS
ncbi:lactosylceramide 4-alpha-galactosyltransferase-like [Glossina fuscipes]|uniref:Lactosylceramide 4-alpha-galactosyltransferase-like n=1 Tax=Glossina fuscipes TaxID=7396 RepID=A0A9C5ZEN7_9MUSC|nr:lactosylceramide 4-alpha-galactosyltransferase-like [Glossina fuscipes]